MYLRGKFVCPLYFLKTGLVVTLSIAAFWLLFLANVSDFFTRQQQSTTFLEHVPEPNDRSSARDVADQKSIIEHPPSSILRTTTVATMPITTDGATNITAFQTANASYLCSEPPPNLLGNITVTFKQPTFEEIAVANPRLKPGGRYSPPNCTSRNGPTAIVVPYRKREEQLRAFLHHIHPILQRQQLEYIIIVVEQAGENRFNRALLMNIGYNESLRLLENNTQFQCYIFHDVDLFPEDDRGIYTCKDKAIHLSGYIDKFNYNLPYSSIFGGASAIPRKYFDLINGYSNVFFGWGGEDDDMHERLFHKKLPIIRYDKTVLRYKMFKHGHESTNNAIVNHVALLGQTVARMHTDGINSLRYRLIRRDDFPTYTRFLVEFTEEEVYTAVFGTPTVKI